jgi:hypothetical protein
MINLTHKSGAKKSIPDGISGTAIFFGCFVPLFRGDFKWAAISFLTCVIGSFLLFIPTIFMWIWLIVKYNEQYLIDLTNEGWEIKKDTHQLQDLDNKDTPIVGAIYGCPNCNKDIEFNFKACPSCGADFSVPNSWKPKQR